MDVLVTSADVKPWKLFPGPEGLQILSLLDPFIDPFPNPFRVLVLSKNCLAPKQMLLVADNVINTYN